MVENTKISFLKFYLRGVGKVQKNAFLPFKQIYYLFLTLNLFNATFSSLIKENLKRKLKL